MTLTAKNIFILLVLIMSVTDGGRVYSETIEDIDRRAEEFYKNKDFNKAIAEWLSILEIDPQNELIQKKIESVYDEKHKKDSSLQIAKIELRLARKSLEDNIKKSNTKADIAWNNFVIAYRIDPKDSDLQSLREEMREFKKILEVENRKTRLSEAMKRQYFSLLPLAKEKMKLREYKDALKIWNELLAIVPLDSVSKEGKRQAELALENRLKYERITALLESGIGKFNENKYQEAHLQFKQALDLDSENKEAKSYLEKINEMLEEKRNFELVRIQAEQLYVNAIENLKKKNFDRAREDFENILSLIEHYKDVQERLRGIERLKKEYEEQQRVARLRIIDVQFEGGLIALTEGRYKDAIMALEAVLLLDPKNSLAKKYIQTAKEAQEQIEEETVTEDSPYFSIINTLMVSGKLLFEKGDYAKSRRRWEKILDLFPKNTAATEYLLKCNIKINPQAFKDFSEKYIAEGRILLKEKKFKSALLRFELIKSVSSDYPNIDAMVAEARSGIVVKAATGAGVSAREIEKRARLGIDYYRKGGEENIRLALQQFKWVNANDPENVSALIYINKIESQLRVDTDHTETVRKLNAKQEMLVRSHYFKGINYYFNNRFDDAISEWRKILAIDPDNEKAKMNIRKCLVLLRR